MTIESTFINLLDDYAPICALEKSKGITKAIVYKLISHVPKKTINSVTYANRKRYQFSCYGKSLQESSNLADQVIGMLDGLQNSGDIKLCDLVNHVYYLDLDTNLYVNSIDFMIF